MLTANKAGPAASGTIGFEDAALVDRTRKGDMQAFGALVAKYQNRVFNMIYRMCGRREDAEELAQETFLRCLQKISQFRSQSRFYTWLFRIAANLVISHRRRSERIRFQSLAGADDFALTQASALQTHKRGRSPAAEAMADEAKRRIEEALEQLDDQMRLVIVLRDMEEMDYAKIAEVLAVPVGTVKSRLHRARLVLKEKLADLIG